MFGGCHLGTSYCPSCVVVLVLLSVVSYLRASASPLWCVGVFSCVSIALIRSIFISKWTKYRLADGFLPDPLAELTAFPRLSTWIN